MWPIETGSVVSEMKIFEKSVPTDDGRHVMAIDNFAFWSGELKRECLNTVIVERKCLNIVYVEH